MDSTEGLSKSSGKVVILVVMDKLTRYAHFIALSHPYIAITVAQKLLDFVVKLHGPPLTIILDKDTIFVSQFRKVLLKVMGTEVKLSPTYHPQTGGQTERVNQCFEMYLKCVSGHKPTQWCQWLPLAELW